MFFNICSDHKQQIIGTHNIWRDQTDTKYTSLHAYYGATGVALPLQLHSGCSASIYLLSNDDLIDVVEGQQHQDWSSPLSPEHASAWHLLKGTGTHVPRPCPAPAPAAYLIGGQEWPRGACQGPLSVGPGAPDSGAHTDSSAFCGFGKINRPPLSSAFVRQRPGVFKLLGLQETKGAAANSSAGQFVCCNSAFSMTQKGHIRTGWASEAASTQEMPPEIRTVNTSDFSERPKQNQVFDVRTLNKS